MRRFHQQHILNRRSQESLFRTHSLPQSQLSAHHPSVHVTSVTLRRFAQFQHQQDTMAPTSSPASNNTVHVFMHSNENAVEKHGIHTHVWDRVNDSMARLKLLIATELEALRARQQKHPTQILSSDGRFLASLDEKRRYMTVHFFQMLEKWNSFLLKGSFAFERCKILLISHRYDRVREVISKMRERFEEERHNLKYILSSHREIKQAMHSRIVDKTIADQRTLESFHEWKNMSLRAAPWVIGLVSLLLAGIGGSYAHSALTALGVGILTKTQVVTGASLAGLLSSRTLNAPTQQLISEIFDEHIQLTAKEQKKEMELLNDYVNRVSHNVSNKIEMLDSLIVGCEKLEVCLSQTVQLGDDLNDINGSTPNAGTQHPRNTTFQLKHINTVITDITQTWKSIREICEEYSSALRKEIFLG